MQILCGRLHSVKIALVGSVPNFVLGAGMRRFYRRFDEHEIK